MTKLAYFALQTLVKEKFPDISAAKKAASIAIGVAVSRLIPLPGLAVESPEEHFAAQVRTTAGEMISAFNEEVVVDVDLALETVRGFWLIRYLSAYPAEDYLVASNGEQSFLVKLTGSARYLNADTQGFCDGNSDAMITLVNRITSAIHQPRVTEVEEEAPVLRG